LASAAEQQPFFVELHVLFVPNEQWNLKLNRVPVEVIKSFISAGFIRVYPDISLRTLRSELGILLGAERDIDKLSFLKCVGRSLALVKAKQERDLKVKYFAPPYVCTFHLNVKICFILCLQKVFIPLDLFQVNLVLVVTDRDVVTTIYFQFILTESVVGKVAPAKKKQRFKRNRASDSGVPESLEDSVFSPTPHRWSTFAITERKSANDMVCFFLPSGDKLIEEIKMAKEERKQLEQTRQELLRKGKDLLAQNRHRRNQARDSWKKSYFDTKKATAPLEVTLRSLRQELEIFYNNILHQLKARDGGGKPRWRARLSSTKNELIIQIMTESHEIDNLRRKVDDAKMRLVTEIKLGKQAATELRALKAELAQKNTQTFLSGSMGFGAGARDRPQAQSIPN
uniref:Spermatogenesis-associated protein 1 C-terminal domain-containing protein n=1 Tax=Oncorhynchus tshawytscha TaxID=74940 RepID=A0A8C8JJ29_ONCTS